MGRFTLHQGENAHKSIEFFIKDSSTEVVPGKNGLISLLLQKPALLGEFFSLRTCENLGTENERFPHVTIRKGGFRRPFWEEGELKKGVLLDASVCVLDYFLFYNWWIWIIKRF